LHVFGFARLWFWRCTRAFIQKSSTTDRDAFDVCRAFNSGAKADIARLRVAPIATVAVRSARCSAAGRLWHDSETVGHLRRLAARMTMA
jgi:hypothetical protein